MGVGYEGFPIYARNMDMDMAINFPTWKLV